MQKQEGTLKDSLFLTTVKNIQYFSVENIQDHLKMLEEDETLLSIYFRKDMKTHVFERRVRTIWDWLSYVGGFWKAIFAVGFLISNIFSYHVFVKHIMSRLYYNENETKAEEEKKK